MDHNKPTFLVPQHWSEMMSIKLKNIGSDNIASIMACDVSENYPFYEPLVASYLSEDPVGLDRELSCEDEQISDMYVSLISQKGFTAILSVT